MSRHCGPQHRGTTREARPERRRQAQLRDDVTRAPRRTPEPADAEQDCE